MDARYANRARQTEQTALPAPHSPKPKSPSTGDPAQSALPAGRTKTTPPILVAHRASQITPLCPIQRNHDQHLPSSEFFSSLLEHFLEKWAPVSRIEHAQFEGIKTR